MKVSVKSFSAIAFAVGVSTVALGDTHTFKPNVVGSNGWASWTEVKNWTNEQGVEEAPAIGDEVIITGNRTIGGCNGTYMAVYYRGSGIGLSGGGFYFQQGGKGFVYESSGGISYWLNVFASAGIDTIYDIPTGKTVGSSENATGSGRILKRGGGTLQIGQKEQTTGRKYDLGGVVIEGGTFAYASYPLTISSQLVFSGNDPSCQLKLGSANITYDNPDFYETNGVANVDHALTSDSSSTLAFTGVPKHEVTAFSGRVLGKLNLRWAPSDAAYELVFSNAVSTTTGTLSVDNGTVRLSGGATFSALASLAVGAGGTFAVDAGSGQAFKASAASLADGAKLALGDTVTLHVTKLTVNGVDQFSGIYGASEEGDFRASWIEGNGRVIVGGDFSAKPIWTAGGTDTLVTSAANWDTAPDLPDLGSNTALLSFGKAGDTATLPTEGNWAVYGMEFTRPFSLAAPVDATPVWVGAGGLTFVGNDPATVGIAWPLAIVGDQQWMPGSNWTVNVDAPLSGAGSLTIATPGRVNFNVPSTLSGKVSLSKGSFYVNATNAVGGAGGSLDLDLGFGRYYFCGHIAIDRPINAPDNSDNNYKGFNVVDDAEVDFNALVSLQYKQRSMVVGKNAIARFKAGFNASMCFQLYGSGNGSGLVIVENVPMTFGDRFYMSGPSVELRVAGNKLNGNVGNFAAGTLYTKVPYAITNIVSGTYQRALMTGATLDLCGNDQALGVLSGWGGKVTSAMKATMHLVDDYDNTETQFNSNNCSVRTNKIVWAGLASLSKEGKHGTWLNAKSTSGGDLSVSKGTLGFLSGGSWANGTNITVKGTGLLQVENAAAFGKQAEISLSESGRMALDYLGAMKVHGLTVDGKRLLGGTYGAVGSGAANTSDRFTGTGILKVAGGGAAIMIR